MSIAKRRATPFSWVCQPLFHTNSKAQRGGLCEGTSYTNCIISGLRTAKLLIFEQIDAIPNAKKCAFAWLFKQKDVILPTLSMICARRASARAVLRQVRPASRANRPTPYIFINASPSERARFCDKTPVNAVKPRSYA